MTNTLSAPLVTAASLLVIEDDDSIRETVDEALRAEGFVVQSCANGAEALSTLTSSSREAVDLIVLDLMLPGLGGLDLCRQLRSQNNNTPILVISARDSETDRVLGLELGADDYLTKPFYTEELLARLRALLRRAAGHSAAALEAGGLRVDTRAARATVNGRPVKLTAHEYRVLSYLIHHQGRVVPRTELVEHIYDQDFDRDSNTIEVFIGRLRKKIGQDRIQTERGLGYRLVVPEGEAAGLAG